MKLSETFRRAAERVQLGLEPDNQRGSWCCCHAIDEVTGDNYSTDYLMAREFFERYFRDNRAGIYWWAIPWLSAEDQDARRLALLFAALIAEEQGL